MERIRISTLMLLVVIAAPVVALVVEKRRSAVMLDERDKVRRWTERPKRSEPSGTDAGCNTTAGGLGDGIPDLGLHLPTDPCETAMTVRRSMAYVGIIAVACVPLTWLTRTVIDAREGARSSQCVGNLKQIGLGLLNYESRYGCFPPAYVAGAKGRKLYS